MDVYFGQEPGPYGPWVDPRSAKPGGCGGAIPDLVWSVDQDDLGSHAWDATAHAMIDPPLWHEGAIHVVFSPAWIVIEPDYAKGCVNLTGRLIDVATTRGLASAIRKLNALDTPFTFAVEADNRVVFSASVPARPFIPVHLGQVLLNLVDFTFAFWRGEIQPDLDGTMATDRVSSEGPGIPWCGTGAIEFQQRYASVEGHPSEVWFAQDDDDEETW